MFAAGFGLISAGSGQNRRAFLFFLALIASGFSSVHAFSIKFQLNALAGFFQFYNLRGKKLVI